MKWSLVVQFPFRLDQFVPLFPVSSLVMMGKVFCSVEEMEHLGRIYIKSQDWSSVISSPLWDKRCDRGHGRKTTSPRLEAFPQDDMTRIQKELPSPMGCSAKWKIWHMALIDEMKPTIMSPAPKTSLESSTGVMRTLSLSISSVRPLLQQRGVCPCQLMVLPVCRCTLNTHRKKLIMKLSL